MLRDHGRRRDQRDAANTRIATTFELFDRFMPGSDRASIGRAAVRTSPASATAWSNLENYEARIETINYALNNDDGMRLNKFDQADVILVGRVALGQDADLPVPGAALRHARGELSRSREEDFEKGDLPDEVLAHKGKIFALTIEPGAPRGDPRTAPAGQRLCEPAPLLQGSADGAGHVSPARHDRARRHDPFDRRTGVADQERACDRARDEDYDEQEYILWLHEVEMSDVDRVGSKNASLGEMLRNLTADGGVKGAGRLCDHGPCLPRVPSPTKALPTASTARSPRSTSTTSNKLARDRRARSASG